MLHHSWNSHVNQVTKMANQTTAFLRRNLSSCSKDVKAQCYKSLVRPQLEYAATTWDPYTKTNSVKVEAVQRRAARFCFNDYRQTSSVSSMMQDLGWEQLQTRRQQNKTVMMYRIVNNLVEIPANQYLTPTGVSTRGHQNDSFHTIALSTPTKAPSSHLRSDSGMPCQPVPYQHNP